MKAIALGLLLAMIVVACAAAPGRTQAVQPHTPGSPHEQIEQLSAGIVAKSQHLGSGPSAPRIASAGASETCERAQTDACQQTCTLADSICGDAKKICDLADTMPGDDWAKGKCESARGTCSDSLKQCCACK